MSANPSSQGSPRPSRERAASGAAPPASYFSTGPKRSKRARSQPISRRSEAEELTFPGGGAMKTVMRQSVDGVTRDHRSRARARGRRGAPAAAGGAPELDGRAGLVHAHARLGVGRQGALQLGPRARRSAALRRLHDVASRALQGSIVFFAAVDLLAAVGLWLAAPWGGVLWLLCASIEAVSPALGVRGAATGALGVALNVCWWRSIFSSVGGPARNAT